MSTRDNYEATPTPIQDLENGEAVITSTQVEGWVAVSSNGWRYFETKRIGQVVSFTNTMIAALNIELYKKLDPKEYVIVWSGGTTLAKPQTLSEAQSNLSQAWDTGTICRLVPLDVAGEGQ